MLKWLLTSSLMFELDVAALAMTELYNIFRGFALKPSGVDVFCLGPCASVVSVFLSIGSSSGSDSFPPELIT